MNKLIGFFTGLVKGGVAGWREGGEKKLNARINQAEIENKELQDAENAYLRDAVDGGLIDLEDDK